MYARSRKRRHCRSLLVLHLDIYWFHIRRVELVLDGIYVHSILYVPFLSTGLTCLRAPTSGGQYHWVSEFAPQQYQPCPSYVVGWMPTLSWQTGNAADCFLTGTISQALIVVNNPSYEPQHWQGTLFVFATVCQSQNTLCNDLHTKHPRYSSYT
jgi:hypothetical protein